MKENGREGMIEKEGKGIEGRERKRGREREQEERETKEKGREGKKRGR